LKVGQIVREKREGGKGYKVWSDVMVAHSEGRDPVKVFSLRRLKGGERLIVPSEIEKGQGFDVHQLKFDHCLPLRRKCSRELVMKQCPNRIFIRGS
jgi:hypothetical protein